MMIKLSIWVKLSTNFTDRSCGQKYLFQISVLRKRNLNSYQSLYNLKIYNLSEATNFHIRAFHLPTSYHMMQFKGMKRQNGNKLEINVQNLFVFQQEIVN